MLDLAADIMSGFSEPSDDAHEIYGVVLLDELGAHLHPQWRMQIVDSLKETFTGIQFLVTTHEPVCLRGLDEDEVAVLERHGDAIQLVEDVPSPWHMRVDQLLTSRFFGLQSTVDPQLDAEFADYYDLIAKGSLTPEEQSHMSDLIDSRPFRRSEPRAAITSFSLRKRPPRMSGGAGARYNRRRNDPHPPQ